MVRTRSVLAAIAALLALNRPAPGYADGLGPGDFFHDAGLYFTAPLR
jgi:hypothetical protein